MFPDLVNNDSEPTPSIPILDFKAAANQALIEKPKEEVKSDLKPGWIKITSHDWEEYIDQNSIDSNNDYEEFQNTLNEGFKPIVQRWEKRNMDELYLNGFCENEIVLDESDYGPSSDESDDSEHSSDYEVNEDGEPINDYDFMDKRFMTT